MKLRDLNSEEVAIVGQCLRAADSGRFFPDWEFETLVGVSREDVRNLAAKWESGDRNDENVDVVVSVLNNLVGYPHGEEAAWRSFITVQPGEVSALLQRIMA